MVDKKAILKDILKSKPHIIFDSDGVVFKNEAQEATRIAQFFFTKEEINDNPDVITAVEGMGFGKNNVWQKEVYEKIIAHSLFQEKVKQEHDGFDTFFKYMMAENNTKSPITGVDSGEAIKEMGEKMQLTTGAKEFLQGIAETGRQTCAIVTDNFWQVAFGAWNKNLSGILTCCEPNTEVSATDAENPKMLVRLNDDYGKNVKFSFKPNPDKLLLQRFKLLELDGVVQRSELDKFLDQTKEGRQFRLEVAEREGYSPAVYIGDDVRDMQAAILAGFDYFIGVTDTGKSKAADFEEVLVNLSDFDKLEEHGHVTNDDLGKFFNKKKEGVEFRAQLQKEHPDCFQRSSGGSNRIKTLFVADFSEINGSSLKNNSVVGQSSIFSQPGNGEVGSGQRPVSSFNC